MIVLVGFMGAGKSTVGRALAERLGMPFEDTDAAIEARTGATIAEIFETAGEGAFRALEHERVAEVLGGDSAVVALGGGALGDPATRAAVSTSTVVHLRAGLDECLQRAGDGGTRPLLAIDPGRLFAERAPIYEACARHHVDTEGKTVDEVAAEIAALVGRTEEQRPPERVEPQAEGPQGEGWTFRSEDRPSRPTDRAGVDEAGAERVGERSIEVAVPGSTYDVIIGAGIAARTAALAGDVGDAEVAFIVTHPSLEQHVAPVAASFEEAGLRTARGLVPEGEAFKSLEVAARLCDGLASAGAHRHDVVVGVGGGVVTDLAGFVASTFNRGMAVVHVPTTLLGQVDAAIGGKTGVNLAAGKNLVGTFWQPRGVVCDVRTLATLDAAEIRAGLAEVVKYGLIARPELLDVVERNADVIMKREPAILADVVTTAVEIKASIVAADEREAGERAYLNYGHTFAHAIEQSAGYEGIRHGEAVALGMMAAAHLARILGRTDDSAVELHRRVLESVGLPTSAGLDVDVLERAWQHDKKYRRGVRFVLLAGIGKPEAGVEVPRDALIEALEALAR